MDWHRAETIVNACHDAWSTRDLDRMFRLYDPEAVYACNTEEGVAAPVRYVGDAHRAFLTSLLDLIESVSVVEGFQFSGNTARTTVGCYMKHYSTGIVLSGQYRQVYTFKNDKIIQLEEFHDAAKLATFWRLVTQTEAMLTDANRSA